MAVRRASCGWWTARVGLGPVFAEGTAQEAEENGGQLGTDGSLRGLLGVVAGQHVWGWGLCRGKRQHKG